MKVGVRRIKSKSYAHGSAKVKFHDTKAEEIRGPITLPSVRATELPFAEWEAQLQEKIENARDKRRIAAEKRDTREFSRHMCNDPGIDASPLQGVEFWGSVRSSGRKPPHDGS